MRNVALLILAATWPVLSSAAEPAPAPAPAPAAAALPTHAASAYSKTTNLPYGPGGCGLGDLIWGPDDNQTIAAITNAVAGQTFAISSGTSDCIEEGVVARDRRVSLFIEANERDLANDAARGGGRAIDGLASLLNCADSVSLGVEFKRRFSEIFPPRPAGERLRSSDLERRIRGAISDVPALRSGCRVG